MVKASIGMPERKRDMRRAVSPDSVKRQMYFASTNSETHGLEGDDATLRPGLGGQRGDALETVGLGRVDDAGHRLDDTDRVLSDARLAREHDRVRTVEDGVGDVAGLGTGGDRVLDHRLEHLRRDDDGLRHAAAELDGALLDDRHGLERKLDAEVATGDHDAVEGVDDLLESVDGLRLLDLGDDGDLAALLLHDLVHPGHIGGVAYERERDDVGPGAQTPAEVGLVLVGQRGDIHGDAGQVDALVVGHVAGDDDLGRDDRALDAGDLDADLAVVDQEEVTLVDVLGEALERRADDLLRSGDVFGRDLEDVADGEEVRTFGEPAEPDLRSLQVDEDGDGTAGVIRRLAHVRQSGVVVGVVAVAEVEAGHVHTGIDDGANHLVAFGGRTQSGDDLRASHRNSSVG